MATVPNIYVSNGTCYAGPGTQADAAMIPCGNSYFQPQACCQHNDHCLQSSVCYNAAHGVTYVAGCTDEEYSASVCPNKFNDEDAPWLGMAFCNDTSNDWVLCDQQTHPGTIVNPDPCACPTATAARSMTLNQAQGIAETASLPDATGLPINWNTDFYPTIPSVLPTISSATRPSTDGASAATSSSSTTTPTAVTAAFPPFPTGFSTSAKIGTAIGASVFGILLLVLLGFFILRHRHQKQQPQDFNDPGEKIPGGGAAIPSPVPDPRTIGVAYSGDSDMHDVSQLSIASPGASELENKAARPWSMISELDNGRDSGCGGSGGGGYAGRQGHMEAIMEASHGQGLGGGGGGGGGHDRLGSGHQRAQGEPGRSELEAPREVVELPA